MGSEKGRSSMNSSEKEKVNAKKMLDALNLDSPPN